MSLATGYGKSLILHFLPIVADVLHNKARGSGIVAVYISTTFLYGGGGGGTRCPIWATFWCERMIGLHSFVHYFY